MMDLIYDYPLYALIVSNAAVLFAASMAILRFERQVRNNRDFWDSPTGASIREIDSSDNDNPEAVHSEVLDRRLSMIHDRIDHLARKKAPVVAAQAAELPIEYAVRLTKNGASVEDLTRQCGLNKAEAHLMCRLHAQQHNANTRSTH